MLREGVSPWLIDNVAQNAGMILGPLTVADLISLDLLTDIFQVLAVHRRGAARYAPESIMILQELTSRSRLGRKSGAGIYDYKSEPATNSFGRLLAYLRRRPTNPPPRKSNDGSL